VLACPAARREHATARASCPGGPREAYERVRPLLEDIAAKVDRDPCLTYLGPGSAGHFVKMVHNGIEYAVMQLLAETYDLMKRGLGVSDDEIRDVCGAGNQGELNAYLIEITSRIFSKVVLQRVFQILGEEDRMVPVAKCYCRPHDVLTAAEAELQQRPTFVFPAQFFGDLESLIGKELEGRIYADSKGRRVKFHLDLNEHAGFQLEEGDRSLYSPWYDDGVLKE